MSEKMKVGMTAEQAWEFQNGRIAGLIQQLIEKDARIAELEAREVVLRQFDEFSICHFGASEDYAKGYIDAQNNANKAIAAAGISIKGE